MGVLQAGVIRIRGGTHSCFIFRCALEIILKGERYMEEPCSNFASLLPSPDCMDLDAKLYIEVADAIGRNQIDLLLELQNRLKNFGIKKPL